jgi:diguanylate cyclase (GGDEF)-like protein
MIALFYATLARSTRRAELAWWARSWWCNFGALALTLLYWFYTPSNVAATILRSLYVGGKVTFALLLVQGVWALRRAGARWLSSNAMIAAIGASVLVAAVFLDSINLIGVAVQGTMGVLFVWCGLELFRERATMTTWLAIGFVARGGLALVEAAAYGANMQTARLTPDVAAELAMFLGAHSSLDLAGEWLLALGGVLAVARRAQGELEVTNDELLAAQGELRRLVDRDPLTGLANRRALPEAFRAVYDSGAALVFCDLDGFKGINDRYGHAMGDACLARFAEAIRCSFRPDDTIVRYAGDEFLVVCRGMGTDMAQERVDQLRARLAERDSTDIAIGFSAGIAELKPGADSEAAVNAADEAMYAAKAAVV